MLFLKKNKQNLKQYTFVLISGHTLEPEHLGLIPQSVSSRLTLSLLSLLPAPPPLFSFLAHCAEQPPLPAPPPWPADQKPPS